MRGLDPESETDPDLVRVCGDCGRAKTIRGVWYLVPARADAPFLCESCFARAPRLRAAI